MKNNKEVIQLDRLLGMLHAIWPGLLQEATNKEEASWEFHSWSQPVSIEKSVVEELPVRLTNSLLAEWVMSLTEYKF